jgi:hypothetical protein
VFRECPYRFNRSRGGGRSRRVKWLVSLSLTPTSRWSARRPPCSATPRRGLRCRQRGGLRGRSCRSRPWPLMVPSLRFRLPRGPPGHGSRSHWPSAACRGTGDRAALAGAGPRSGPAGPGGPARPGSSPHPAPGDRALQGARPDQVCSRRHPVRRDANKLCGCWISLGHEYFIDEMPVGLSRRVAVTERI